MKKLARKDMMLICVLFAIFVLLGLDKYKSNHEIIQHSVQLNTVYDNSLVANFIIDDELQIADIPECQRYNPLDKYTQEELELLYAITWAEAGNEPYEGQVGVANVIINRVEANTHPSSIEEVVYQGNGSQFNAIRRSTFGYYTEETVMAVHEAIRNPMFPSHVVYFANVKISTNRGFVDRVILKHKVAKIGGHTFASDPKLKKEE